MKKTEEFFLMFKAGKCGLEDVYRAMCEDIVNATGATRASVWLFDQDGKQITCKALYDKRSFGFYKDMILTETDFPAYFKAIKENFIVNAPDAHRHPSTQCFNELYFYPNNIFSLLDYILMVGTTPVGILCCENCDEVKKWTKDHESYLSQQSAILGLIQKFAQH